MAVRAMRFWVATLALVAVLPIAASDAAGPAYHKTHDERGFIACAASAGGLVSDSRCGELAQGNHDRFDFAFDPDLSGVLLEIEWVRASTAAPTSLRIEIQEALDEANTTAWEGTSPGRFVVDSVRADVRDASGTLALAVGAPRSTPGSVVSDSEFRLAVTFFHGGPGVPQGFSALHGDAPPASDPTPGKGEPSSVPLAATSRGWSPPRYVLGLAIGLGALGVAATPGLRRTVAACGVLLFSRLDEDRVAQHPRRAELLALVQAKPGVGAEEARAQLAIGRGAFDHHVRVLHLRRLLRRVQVQGKAFLYPGGTGRPVAPEATGLPLRLLETVRREPGLRQVDLAQRLRVPERTLRHHALWLARRGRLRLEADGRAVRCFPTP